MLDYILHVGAPRTGTTRIQTILADNSDSLSANGVLPLTPQRAGKRGVLTVRSAIGLARTSAFKRTGWILKHVARRRLRTLIPKGTKSVVISDESMLGPTFDRTTGEGLFLHAVASLRSMVHLTGNQISRVVVAIRSYETFIPSACAMAAIYNRDKYAPLVLRNPSANPSRGWPELIDDIQATFPKAEVVAFRFENTPIEVQLQTILGENLSRNLSITKTGIVNAAPTLDAIEYVQGEGINDHRHADEIIKQFQFGERFDPFSEDEKERLRLRYDQDCECIMHMNRVQTLGLAN